MKHVYWITPTLAGRCGPSEHVWNLEELYQAGFRAIVSLDDNVEPQKIVNCGFEHIPLYLPDVALTTPELKFQFLEAALTFVQAVNSFPYPVLVHCYAGNDRTGAMLACFLISQGERAEEAVAEIRKRNPHAMTTPGYEEVVHMFEASI